MWFPLIRISNSKIHGPILIITSRHSIGVHPDLFTIMDKFDIYIKNNNK